MYVLIHTQARYKQSLDPTLEDVRKLCLSLRRAARDERVLFHYNGHGVPRPTPNGEMWVFNKVLSAHTLISALLDSTSSSSSSPCPFPPTTVSSLLEYIFSMYVCVCVCVHARVCVWWLCMTCRTTRNTFHCPFTTCNSGWGRRPFMCLIARPPGRYDANGEVCVCVCVCVCV